MFFHVTMTHKVEDCAGYHDEIMSDVMGMLDRMKDLENEFGINVHNLLLAGPEHTFFAVVEADTMAAVSRWFFEFPMKQEAKITPVESIDEFTARVKSTTNPT